MRINCIQTFVHVIFAVVALSIGTSAAKAQQTDLQLKLQLASSYERGGDWERAVSIYEELYARDSSNIVLFENLRRGYMQLKRHDDAIRLIQAQLQRRPNDVTLFANLGVVYAREGNESKAVDTWNQALALDRRNVNAYHLVANAAIESRLLERALYFYLEGRKAIGEPMAFTMEIANLHIAMMNIADATREYMKLLAQSPSQLNIVQSRMSSFAYRDDARREATKVVEESLRSNANTTAFYQLLAWLLMEGKQFERAFETYVQLDRRTNAGGRELYAFAERAFKEKAYAIAAKTYEMIIRQYPNFDRIALVKFGYARTTEELIVADDSTELRLLPIESARAAQDRWSAVAKTLPVETQSRLSSVVNSYRAIVSEFPRTEIAAQSLYRIAFIQYQYQFDLDAAAATLQRIQTEYSYYPHRTAEATLLLGDVLLNKGELDNAERQYRSSMQYLTTKELALYRLAELEFFRQRFNESLSLLKELTKEPKSDVTNDALSLMTFIEQHSQPSHAALGEFARAQLLIRQRKFPDALLALEKLEKTHTTSSLLDETLMLKGSLLSATDRYTEAIQAYRQLFDKFPESIMLDRAMMNAGYIHEAKLKNSAEAITLYQQVLERFPNSLFANEARRRIRELRGERL